MLRVERLGVRDIVKYVIRYSRHTNGAWAETGNSKSASLAHGRLQYLRHLNIRTIHAEALGYLNNALRSKRPLSVNIQSLTLASTCKEMPKCSRLQ